jgi:hypothetical protein
MGIAKFDAGSLQWFYYTHFKQSQWGRAIAQVTSCWVPTAAVQFRARVRSCRICGGQYDTGAGFLRVLRFPLPIIPPIAPYSSSSNNRGWYNRPNSGRRAKWTQSRPPLKKVISVKCKENSDHSFCTSLRITPFFETVFPNLINYTKHNPSCQSKSHADCNVFSNLLWTLEFRHYIQNNLFFLIYKNTVAC